MSGHEPTTEIVTPERPLFDQARLAVAGFLARFSGPTRISYTADLRGYFAWCCAHDLAVFAVKRGHLELWARTMEDAGLAERPSAGACQRWRFLPVRRHRRCDRALARRVRAPSQDRL